MAAGGAAAVWFGSGEELQWGKATAELPQGYAGSLMATAVCCLRGRDACV